MTTTPTLQELLVGVEGGFMRLHPHLPSDYVEAAAAVGMHVVGCEEPPLTEQSVATPAAEPIPDANRAAYVGLPGVIVWELERAR